ncbi:hypothetical protein I552_5065 [Mycobacterium xenopi 3993]|nr:hypothetical protein I552_5065 [Mycobacterium xenopi 3993]
MTPSLCAGSRWGHDDERARRRRRRADLGQRKDHDRNGFDRRTTAGRPPGRGL